MHILILLIIRLHLLQSVQTAHQEVVFQSGQFVVEEHSCAVDLMPDIETSKRVYNMLPQQFDTYASKSIRSLLYFCRLILYMSRLLPNTVIQCIVMSSCSCCRNSAPS